MTSLVDKLVSREPKQSDAEVGWYQRFDFAPGQLPHEAATGEVDTRFDDLDRLMRQFIQTHQVPGAAIAVADHGQIVLARGYGYADVEAGEVVRPTSLFRIASISKAITACAILQLVQRGRLELDMPVFSVLGFDAEIEQAAEGFDARLRNVTIQHLLTHTSGWDMAISVDPMSQVVAFALEAGEPPPADQRTIIRAMLSRSLDFEPGTRFAYSNFG